MTSKTGSISSISLSKAVIAVVLCYVLFVQTFTVHHHLVAQTPDGLHEICINDPIAIGLDGASRQQSPIHDPDSTCCLIAGSGHLPHIASIISIVTFPILLKTQSSDGFQLEVDFHLVQAPSLPRAPPHMG